MMVESGATRSPAEPAAVLESRTRVTGLSAGLYSGESSSYTRNAGAECSGGETVADILVIDDDDDLRDTLRAASITAPATCGHPASGKGSPNPQFFRGLGASTW